MHPQVRMDHFDRCPICGMDLIPVGQVQAAEVDPGPDHLSLGLHERQMARVEAIVLSMTPHERRVPHVINGPRRRRIAAGSGTSIDEVNRLLQARKQMAKMVRQLGKGKLPTLPPELTQGPRR